MEQNFISMSENLRNELVGYDSSKLVEFKDTFITYFEDQMAHQNQVK